MHGLSVTADRDDADAGRGLDDLARAASDGDSEAFERLVREVYARIHRWALVRIGDPDDADDVTQTVLVKLHASLDRWRGESRFTTWLYRITANEASSWRRRVKRRARWMVRDTGELGAATDLLIGPAETGERAMTIELIRGFFRELPPRQREVCDLVDFQGYEPAEVAEMLEMNPNTVRANLFKARRTIRERVTKESEAR